MLIPGIEMFHDKSGGLAALVVRAHHVPDGIKFYTPLDQTQQLGIMRRPAGYVVEAHEHTPQVRQINDTNEVLLVRSGRLEVTLFDGGHQVSSVFEVGPSEVVLLASGGHGIRFMEDSVVLEVKQGPYVEVADKVRFEPKSRD